MKDWGKAAWLITGCSSGLGRAIANAVLQQGGRVIATARNPDSVADIVDGSGGRAIAVKLDVTNPDDIAAAVKAGEEFGGIDVLVNNAGYGMIGGVEASSDEEIRAQFEVNFFGATAMMQAVLPAMRARKSGYIINISSIAGSFGGPGGGIYSATKFALEGLSESLSREAGELGIKVLIVAPGEFRTNFAGSSIQFSRNHIEEYSAIQGTFDYLQNSDGMQAGDPVRAANIILDTLNSDNPPLRLILGLESYPVVHGVLTERLRECESQKELALTACFPEALQ